MSVYVDNANVSFGRMVMSHMWADADDELLAMADTIGVDRKWIQGHPTLSLPRYRSASWVHFDIALVKKAKAIAAGAILMDKFAASYHCAKLKGQDKMMASIIDLRARRGWPADGRIPTGAAHVR